MQYDFSSQFLRVSPPDTTFAEAWESLCALLIGAEHGVEGLLRLKPPDRGVDILHRPQRRAYQCKSTKGGMSGTARADSALKSLTKAFDHRRTLDWARYGFATNAYFSGMAVEKILQRVRELGLCSGDVEFFGPDYWDRLCTSHSLLVKDRFDYRVSVVDKAKLERVDQASRLGAHLTAADLRRYLLGEHPAQEEIDRLLEEDTPLSVLLSNNLIELELEILVSPNLTAGDLLDFLLDLLKFSREWVNFRDLNASASPRVTIKINGKEIVASQMPLGKIGYRSEGTLEISIDFDVRDELTPAGVDEQVAYARLGLVNVGRLREFGSPSREETLRSRATELAQCMLWAEGRNIKTIAETRRLDEAA